MRYSELNAKLSGYFPALQPVIDLEMDNGYKPVPHVLYENVLNPYVIELLRDDDNPDEIKRVFVFYERLAASTDDDVRDLLQETLLDALRNDYYIYNNALKHMLPKTRQIISL